MKSIIWFKDATIKDIPQVGGKNASLGEMYSKLIKKGINIPNGFATTAAAYQEFLKVNGLDKVIKEILSDLDTKDITNLQKRGQKVRSAILQAELQESLKSELLKAYQDLSKQSGTNNTDVAVRSSATAEDLPGSSFAGQQETFLNVVGKEELFEAVKKCYASLFTDRAISYRVDKGFDHLTTYLSVGVQKMVRSDKACSGVMFTLDPETGFDGVVVVTGAWGLGETIVQGEVVPDEFQVFKGTFKSSLFKKSYPAIIKKSLGTKLNALIYAGSGDQTKMVEVSEDMRHQFILNDKEILKLAEWGMKIEEHYKKPMDLEWAKDGRTGELFIVQARPETAHGTKKITTIDHFVMNKTGKLLAKGAPVGTKIAEGQARIIKDVKGITSFQKGEVLITRITDPDWEPVMKIASAIVTDEGGRTSHAAIVSRELGIPCIVGTGDATSKIHMGEFVTVDCSSGNEGFVWGGKTEWEKKVYSLKKLPKPKTKVMVNVGNPGEAYEASFLPADGVGLAREEFIIASQIKVHPLALIHFDQITDPAVKKQIEQLTVGFSDKKDFYVERLAQGIGQIAAAFYPKPVIVRFSDFKTNEYATLLGGSGFEPKEENPMIGWRGASRYYDPRFEEAFGLECKAMKIVREKWGLKNMIPMVPFCRTPDEGQKVLDTMAKFGFKKGENDLKVYMMAEIPDNILEIEKYAKLFDGFSIGSNDLTQLTLGIDRDNAGLSGIANEKSAAVKSLISTLIKAAKKHHKYVGICGQAPSDYADFAAFLVQNHIESISLNPDSVLKTMVTIVKQEKSA